jgi:hypothetical protein
MKEFIWKIIPEKSWGREKERERGNKGGRGKRGRGREGEKKRES